MKIIKTQNGAQYMLSEKDGKSFFRKGLLAGEILKFHEEVKVGGMFHIDFIKEGLYCTPDTTTMFLRTGPITEIVSL